MGRRRIARGGLSPGRRRNANDGFQNGKQAEIFSFSLFSLWKTRQEEGGRRGAGSNKER